MSGRRWTTSEKTVITNMYARQGIQATLARLHKHGYTDRSEWTVRRKAQEMGHKVGVPKGYISLHEMIEMAQGVWHYKLFQIVREKARVDGVLLHTNIKRPRWSVPLEWAYAWLDDLDKRRTLEFDEKWLTAQQLRERLGLTYNQLLKARKGKSQPWINDMVSSIEARRGVRNKWLYNPSDVERAAKEFDRDYARAA